MPGSSRTGNSLGVTLDIASSPYPDRHAGSGPPSLAPLLFSILGPLSVSSELEHLAIGGARRRAILARLLVERSHSVPLGRLAEDAWDGGPPTGAASTLRSHLSSLRKVLGQERLYSRDGSAVVVVMPGELDSDVFDAEVAIGRQALARRDLKTAARSFERSIAMWRGSAFSDVEGYVWAIPEVSRLDERRLEVREGLLETRLRLGQYLQVAAEAEQVVRENPLREQVWAILMVALYQAGRQAEALRAYQRVRLHLTEELGIEPWPVLRILEQSILNQEDALAQWMRGRNVPPLDSFAARSSPARISMAAPQSEFPVVLEESDLSWVPSAGSPSFVGRDTEFELAMAARERSRNGHQVLLVISGEPGIGKTRLAAEVAISSAAAGDLVLYGRCNEQPLSSFEGIRAALSRIIRYSIGTATLERMGRQRLPLCQVIPEALSEEQPVAGAGLMTAEAERYQSFEAVNSFVGFIAEVRPVVFVLEDLHWADLPGLALLEHMLRSKSDAPILFVTTIRTTELGHVSWLDGDLVDLGRTVDVCRVRLDGLSPAMSLALFEDAVRGDSTHIEIGADRLQEYTGGNPFFVQEVATDVVKKKALAGELLDREASISDRLRELVSWRLAMLTPSCRNVLSVAALVGLHFQVGVLIAASSTNEETILDILDEAQAAGVIVEVKETADSYRFAHDLVRHSLEAGIGVARRTRTHLKIAQVLEAINGLNQAHAAEIAFHYIGGIDAGAAGRARLFCRLAGLSAMEHVAYEAAVEHFARALEIGETHFPDDLEGDCELLLFLADAMVKSGRLPEADELYKRAFLLGRDLGRIDMSAAAAIGFGGTLPAGVEPSESGLQMLQTTLVDLGQGDKLQRALVLGRQAHWSHFCETRERRQSLADEAVQVAMRLDDLPTIAATLEYRYWALCGPDEIDRQLDDGRRIREVGEGIGDPEIVLRGIKCELHAELERGDFAEADRKAQRMRELADRVRQPEFQRLGFMWESLVAGIQGRFDDAERSAADAYSIFRRSGHSQTDAIAVGLSITWLWLQGRLGEMRPILEAGRTGRSSLGERALSAWIAADVGDLDEAREILAALPPEEIEAADHNFHWWFMMVGLTQAACKLGDAERADQLYRLISPFSTHNCRVGQATFLGSASYYLGCLARTAGRSHQAVAHLREALERHRTMDAMPFVDLSNRELDLALGAC